MLVSNWNLQETGKRATSRDREYSSQLQQQKLERQVATDYALNRRRRAISVVSPAMRPIKLVAQQLCAEFNRDLRSQGSQAEAMVYEDLGGMGLRGIPAAFAVMRNPKIVELIPDYQTWQIAMQFSDGASQLYEVDDEAAEGRVRRIFYSQGGRRVTAEEIAVAACKFVCQ